MTTREQNALQQRADDVVRLIGDALAWTADEANTSLVGEERTSLTRAFRQNQRRARRLARAAGSKMCVSVFGPSQAGKSYLVSALARPECGQLVADYAGEDGQLDYISQVNPEGEGESTGLVTRFTMSRVETPEGFPIPLRLLGEADIVRIILNSFFMDGDRKDRPPEAAELEALLKAFRGKAAGAETGGISEDDVWEIRDYIESNFSDAAYTQAVASFWEGAAEIVPRLAQGDRAECLSILWARHDALTDLYVTLSEARRRCGDGEFVFAPRSALVPREESIIDVKTLQGLCVRDDREPLPLQLESGGRVSLPRPLICALAAELVLPMRDKPSDLFDHTDLLDFPGARNRFKAPLAQTLREAENTVPQLFLRGKVAYLFDRYVTDQEITSMLLCIPDSNMEAIDLPGLVENWISLTHGATPEERKLAECILFFVMTKFDKHLIDVGGSDINPVERFQRRITASFEKFGQMADSWPLKWVPDAPFRNCFWLRNPIFYAEAIIRYDQSREPWREVELLPEKQVRIEELGRGHNSAPLVLRHFSDPAAAWEAALALNDGGVSFLLSRLADVCVPGTKERQVAAQLSIVVRDLEERLQPYFVSEDQKKRLDEQMALADRVVDAIHNVLDRGKIGPLLGALMVGADAVADRISRVPDNIRIGSKPSEGNRIRPHRPAGGTPTPDAQPESRRRPRPRPRPGRSAEVREPGSSVANPAGQGDAQEPEIQVVTREEFQAATAVRYWIETMRRASDDPKSMERLGISRGDANIIVSEIIHAARRTGLKKKMTLTLEPVNYSLSPRAQSIPAGLVCAEEINRFVEALGQHEVDPKDRPTVEAADGESRPVFMQKQIRFSAADLPATPVNHAEDFGDDWVFALDEMFRQNALHGDDGTVNLEQNLRLGEILAGLRERKSG